MALFLAGCATLPPPAPAPVVEKAIDASAVEVKPIAQAPVASTGVEESAGPERATFGTKYAWFEPARFGDLPGWREDRFGDAWQAFRQSCKALNRRGAWADPCARAANIKADDDQAIRRFLEAEFTLYQIYNADHSPAGVITGYYEPLLNGSRKHGGKYVYPIHAAPDDLLYLDARRLPTDHRGRAVHARIDGRNVVVVPSGTAPYTLDLGGAQPDIRDKKMRVRAEGGRIVPYFTRADIERGAAKARVLAWVDNPVAAYIMQIQGSGKVRLPDGHIMRLAYAEQNGQPFQPPVQPTMRAVDSADVPLVRGLPLALGDWGEASGTEQPQAAAGDEPLTRGVRSGSAARAAGSSKTEMPPDVADVVEALLQQAAASGAGKKGGAAPVGKAGPAAPGGGSKGATAKTPRAPDQPKGAPPATSWPFSSDPSYVFFREIPDSEAGPVGALGVPLTAGRSIAVDPRTTPLGFPVFISTTEPGKAERLNRLMLAQDTGGAIRGAVRADYFWGFGPGAGAQASRMKQDGRMWLLWPKEQPIGANAKGMLTRGTGGTDDAECVLPDPELCVE